MKTRIKELRNRKGLSQEELAEMSELSLRTIQRIENGQTEPLGDSLKKIAFALKVDLDELTDWVVQEDIVFLKILNLSALTFLLFPILGAIIPYYMWNSKKNTIKGIQNVGTNVVNFQLTWNLLLFLGVILTTASTIVLSKSPSIAMLISHNGVLISALYTVNFLLIVFNTTRIQNEEPLKYYPKIKFL
ncbi:helix-turn-helix domain-containing protein [Reichenbachiella versicolor]|uniref:helix-turn-helix domain-containing protein n=1 Tax=Reichenbachiella versicolor TaxID=1821036 RepID=UPI000D6E64DE|nr:helix-turn-helix domain-containing protein [Reichenbachiella versicolor]